MPDDSIEIIPLTRPLDTAVRPPGSKSITNRALLLASLARGTSTLTGVLDSEDTRLMAGGLQQLGVGMDIDWPRGRISVDGVAGRFPVASSDIFCGNSGTTLRFLTAALAFSGGRHRLYGVSRMHERPVGDLVAALRMLGCNITTLSPNGCPPVLIDSVPIRGGHATVRSETSSQFLSALLMAGPMAPETVTVKLEGNPVSVPYIDMTLKMMPRFGVLADVTGLKEFQLRRGFYQATDFDIEPDASAASYFFGCAAIAGGKVQVAMPGRDSLQGDVEFVELLARMGCTVTRDVDHISVAGPALRGIECDMSSISDTAQTLAVIALFVSGPTTIRGISHNRVKETDRIGNLAIELRKLGATVHESDDGMTIVPGELRPATLETHEDHRMAMSLALAGLKIPGVRIRNPECVRKTFPDYFAELARLEPGAGFKDPRQSP